MSGEYDYSAFFDTALEDLWRHGMDDLFVSIASYMWWGGRVFGGCECENFDFQAESRSTVDPEVMFLDLTKQINKWLEGREQHE